jgi:HK97 family phage major capsid protein
VEDDIDQLEADLKVAPYGTRGAKSVDELRAGFTRLMTGHLERSKGIKSFADQAGRELFASEQRDYSKSLSIAGRAKVGLDGLDELVSRPGLKAMIFPGGPSGFPGAEPTGPLAPGEARPLSKGMKMAEVVGSPRPGETIGLHRYLRGLVTGDWRGVSDAAMKAMSLGGAGVYTVPEPLSAQLIDLARDASVLGQSGMVTYPMTASTLKIPRLTADPTAIWHAENFNESASDATFDNVTLTAKTVMAFVQMSVELAEDAPIADDAVSNALGKALGRAIDKAGLIGAGGDEPAGIYGQVPSNNVGGPFLDYNDLSKAVQIVRTANEEPTTLIWSAKTAGDVDRFVDQNDQPLRPPPSVEGLTKLLTNGIGDDVAIVGDFSKLAFGVRTSLRIEASRDAGDGTSGAFSALQVWIRAYARCDFAVLRPAAFLAIEGLASS